MKNKSLSRRLKYGSVAVVFTVVFIVLVAAVNVIISAVADKYPLYFDMTSEALYDISDVTVQEINSLDPSKQVKIMFFAKKDKIYDIGGDVLEMVSTLADKYDSMFDNVTVEYIDLVSTPNIANKYKKTSADTVKQTTVVFACEQTGASKIVQLDGFYSFMVGDDGQRSVYSFDGEKRITSYIKQVASADAPHALFTTGHGEPAPSLLWLGESLGNEGYEVGTVNLANEDIPTGTELVVIYYPTYDFAGLEASKAGGVNEIAKLSAYLKDFGNVIVILSPTTRTELTELSAVLSEWGIDYTPGAIVTDSPENSIDNQGFFIAGKYAGEKDNSYAYELHKGISEKPSAPRPICYYSVPLTISEVSGKVVEPVVVSSRDAYIATNEETFPAGAPVALAALSVMPRNNVEGKLGYSNLLVIGSPYFFDATLASVASYGNAELLYGALKHFGNTSTTVSIEPKVLAKSELSTEATGETARTGIIYMSVAVPVIVLVLGVLVWRKRKFA